MSFIRQNKCLMWWSIQVLLLIAFFLSACGTTHQTYTYHGPIVFDRDHTAGSVLSIRWQARSGQIVTDSSPVPLVLEVSLIGPFPHIDDIVNAMKKYVNDPTLAHMGPVMAIAPPIQTNNWTGKTFTSILTFPNTLQSGYYILALTVNGEAATREVVPLFVHSHV